MTVTHEKKSRKKLGYNKHSGLRRRGSGNKGGFGAAGHGKKCKQKKHQFMKNGQLDYGKHGFTSKSKKVDSVSVGLLNEQAEKLAEKKGEKFHINLKGNKVLGNGTVTLPLVLSNFCKISEKAKDKVLKAGGELIEK